MNSSRDEAGGNNGRRRVEGNVENFIGELNCRRTSALVGLWKKLEAYVTHSNELGSFRIGC